MPADERKDWPINTKRLLLNESHIVDSGSRRSLAEELAQAECECPDVMVKQHWGWNSTPEKPLTSFSEKGLFNPFTPKNFLRQYPHLDLQQGEELNEGYSHLEAKLNAFSNDLLVIKKYLQESTGLLSTLAKILKAEVLESRCNCDSTKAMLAVTTRQDTASPCPKDKRTKQTKADKSKHLQVNCKSQKKTKNIKGKWKQKTICKQTGRARNCKRGLKKLFTLIPPSRTLVSKKRGNKNKGLSKRSHDTTNDGKVVRTTVANQGPQNINVATQTFWETQVTNMTREKDDRNSKKIEQADGSKSPMANHQDRRQKINDREHYKDNWNLVLIPNKVVFIKVPNPGKLSSLDDRKSHVISLMNKVLPGGLYTTDIDQIDYLYNDALYVDAIVSFIDLSIAKFIIRARDLFAKKRHHDNKIFPEGPHSRSPRWHKKIGGTATSGQGEKWTIDEPP
nr:PREDICTED: uncharacterized protein LOC107983612 [Anolis carolinensis]|eukprot:XP_016853313.1 PREDICTED: uncharacterized protein LOC107983612 [Anolis carolinensis]